jgi:hypothetical protein
MGVSKENKSNKRGEEYIASALGLTFLVFIISGFSICVACCPLAAIYQVDWALESSCLFSSISPVPLTVSLTWRGVVLLPFLITFKPHYSVSLLSLRIPYRKKIVSI